MIWHFVLLRLHIEDDVIVADKFQTKTSCVCMVFFAYPDEAVMEEQPDKCSTLGNVGVEGRLDGISDDTLDAAVAFVVVVADRRGARRRRLHGRGGGLEGRQHQNNSGHLHFLAEREMGRLGFFF